MYYQNNKEKVIEKVKEFRENNKETIKDRKKVYREKYKFDIQAKKSALVQCECGLMATSGHIQRHRKTKQHQKKINEATLFLTSYKQSTNTNKKQNKYQFK